MKMLTRILATLVAGAFLIGAAWAGNMEARFGNTVVATGPDGTVTKFWYKKDGTFTAKAEQPGQAALNPKGKWRQDGDKLCITSDTSFGPFEANKERCVPADGRQGRRQVEIAEPRR